MRELFWPVWTRCPRCEADVERGRVGTVHDGKHPPDSEYACDACGHFYRVAPLDHRAGIVLSKPEGLE